MHKLAKWAAAAALTLTSLPALAVPVAVAPTGSGANPGLNALWVTSSIGDLHNTAAAVNRLDNPLNDSIVANTVASTIDYTDCCGGYFAGGAAQAVPGDHFAVRFTGFYDVEVDGNYELVIYSDDGFRLTLGGENILEYGFDTGPTVFTVDLFLTAGLYPIELVQWEQGGFWVVEMSEINFDTGVHSLSDSFYRTVGNHDVPEPMTLSLLGAGLAGIAAARRKRA